jgi:dTDP-4-amino-4,6-dideoxygalactose transaminase
MIPFVDLKSNYLSIKNEIDNAIQNCLSETDFIKGKSIIDFERLFSKYIGTDYCMSCGNGTDAIEIILTALGIGPGDEVIVPALTWISTAEAVNNVGAEPVFVDINQYNYTIDFSKIKEKITARTKAIIPVHLYGCPADLDEILSIAKNNGLYVIEDCAQAHGAEYKGKKVGTFGIASSFSFFPSKNLGAYGDGGAIVTNDPDVNEKIRMIANHGQLNTKHHHKIIGRNSRLDTIQAAILNVKINYLDSWNAKRIEAAEKYNLQLSKKESIVIPEIQKDRKHVFHLYVIRSAKRDRIIKALSEKKISTGIHYPKPLPFVEAYSYKKHQISDFPVSTIITNEILSLPMFPEITSSQIIAICDSF